jgi:hypothetical protein
VAIDEEIDLRNLEANRLQIEIEFQFGEDLELLAKHPLIPRRIRLLSCWGKSDSGAGAYPLWVVKGAIDDVVLGNLTGLLAHIKPAI